MNQDNALRKGLKARQKKDLPYAFENRLMNQIMLEAVKKKKRTNALTMSIISLVSFCMIVGVVLVLKYYLSVDLSFSMPVSHFTPESKPLFGFFFYIGFLVLVLLGVDAWVRKKNQHSEK
jgi:hypothetical protein